MNLSAVHIEGFKSFAKKTDLPFQPGITAVIGPNGSGKSNVTEAIRWVLGEQSIKQLRGKEHTDVIFHGAGETSASRKARVTLIFNNESGRFPGNTAEVSIARSLTRDGESRYTINGDDVRLLDLQRMLAEAGVGARTFTVISQGTVDRYLTATPAARRELFDEATGVRSLQLQLLEAHRKLQKTQHHALEIEAIIKELAPRLTLLSRQVQRYEVRGKLSEEYIQKQRAWFSHAWHSHMGEITKTDALISSLQETIAEAAGQRRQLEGHLFAKQESDEASLVRSKLASAQAEYTTAYLRYNETQEQRSHLEVQLKEVRQKLAEATSALEEARVTSGRFDLAAGAEDILSQCLTFIENVISGDVSKDEATALKKMIAAHIKQLREMPATQAAKMMVTTIEKPLQEVARLSTLEQEWSQQLEMIKVPELPSEETVKDLQTQLSKLASQGSANEEKIMGSLESARQQELEAERSASAATAAADGLRRELQQLEDTILRELGSAFLEEIQQKPLDDTPPTESQLRTLSSKLAAIGEPDPLIVKEYAEAKSRHEHLTSQLHDIQQAATNIVDLMGTLHKQVQQQFAERFAVIQNAFSEIFVELFGGGGAQISQTEVGIEISVSLPGKKSRHVTLLSGGERALTSLALLMAILQAQNPPFIVLDEVDAALDEANSRRFALLLKKRCQSTQCIVVTHNREVMGVADTLYGVTMQREGISSVYSVSLADVAETDSATHTTTLRV